MDGNSKCIPMNQPTKPYDKWIQLKMSSVNNCMTFEVETSIEQKFPEAHALNNVTMSLSDAFMLFIGPLSLFL